MTTPPPPPPGQPGSGPGAWPAPQPGTPQPGPQWGPPQPGPQWGTPSPGPGTGGRSAGWTMLAVFVVAELTFLLVSLLALVPFAIADPTLVQQPFPGPVLLVALAVPTLCAALVAVGGTRLFGGGPAVGRVLRELAVRWNWRDVGIGLALGAGGLALTIPASALWARYLGGEDPNSAVGEIFDSQSLAPPMAVVLFLVVWLVAPLCEEVLFRGALWRAFEHWHWNRWLIFAVTTVVFSFAHLELLRTPLLLVISIPIGLARLFTGNLVSSVVAHQANNFLPAIGLLLMTLGVMPA